MLFHLRRVGRVAIDPSADRFGRKAREAELGFGSLPSWEMTALAVGGFSLVFYSDSAAFGGETVTVLATRMTEGLGKFHGEYNRRLGCFRRLGTHSWYCAGPETEPDEGN